MKIVALFLILFLALGTAWVFLKVSIPVGGVEVLGADFDTVPLKNTMIGQSFITGKLPDLMSLKNFDRGVKDVILERFFPFDLLIRWSRYKVLLVFSWEGKSWELFESGEFAENQRVSPTITGFFFSWPLLPEVTRGITTFFSRIPDRLIKTIEAFKVESAERVVLQLNDGLDCFFSLNNYERHIPYLELYISRAQKDGKKELHFEYSEVYAK
ncbi:MAG: hypothetical protein NUV68_06585 [Caldiserica bacterium]|jgi:hypothetical protein|nr:hypothetical protein [Caldisericota bacterium]MDH7562987.1 hypothetical protein [Caldisericota bacterium]